MVVPNVVPDQAPFRRRRRRGRLLRDRQRQQRPISVTVGEGAEVTGAKAGIWVANAGAMGTGDERIPKQNVDVFGSLGLEQEFSEETVAKASGTALAATAEATRFRLVVGGDRRRGDGRYALRGSANYAAGGGGARDFGAGVNFAMRF